MGEVHAFASARQRDLTDAAEQINDAEGEMAGYNVGLVARLPGTPPEIRAGLLEIVDEIERIQGLGWVFPDQVREWAEEATAAAADAPER